MAVRLAMMLLLHMTMSREIRLCVPRGNPGERARSDSERPRLVPVPAAPLFLVLDDHTPPCNCSPPALCSAISHGIYYLYPFNIEYQILASTMLYVLWKNIGRRADGRRPRTMRFRFQGVALGSGLGLAVLAATIGVVALYLIHIGRSKTKSEAALILFYLYASALLALMGVAGLAGLRLSRLDDGRSLDASRNPARKLDADLLVGTASGSWLLSWGSILAILCAEARPAYAWYNLPYSVLVIAEKYIQNLFIIEAAHRAPAVPPGGEDVGALQVAVVCNGRDAPRASAGLQRDNPGARDPGSQLPPAANGSLCLREVSDLGEAEPSWAGAPGPCLLQGSTPRSLLRNIAAFLFLCNISVIRRPPPQPSSQLL